MASQIVPDSENPMLKKKDPPKKKNPLWDFSGIPSSVHPSQMLSKQKSSSGWGSAHIRPYVTVRDLNDSDSDNENRKPVTSVEIGLQGTF